MEDRKTSKSYSPEVRARAVRMVQEHGGENASRWAAISSIAAEIGCYAETLRPWVGQSEPDRGKRAGLTTDERKRLKGAGAREPRASAGQEILARPRLIFAPAELDRRHKP